MTMSDAPKEYKVHEAKAKFSEVLEKAMLGEAVVIYKGNRPVAKVSPVAPTGKRKIGSAKGQVHMSDDFDAPLDDFTGYQ